MKKSLANKVVTALCAFGMLSGVFSSCSFESDGGGSNLGLLAAMGGGMSFGGGDAPAAVNNDVSLYRLGTSADADFSGGVLTDFGTNDAYLYFPTALDLATDTAVIESDITTVANTGRLGLGFINVEGADVTEYVFATTSNKVRYKKAGSENGSGWDSGFTLNSTSPAADVGFAADAAADGKCPAGSVYKFRAELAGGRITFTVMNSNGTELAKKSNAYGTWLGGSGKVYMAIGSAGATGGNTSNVKFANVKAGINGNVKAVNKITDIPDMSSVVLSASSLDLAKDASDSSITFTAIDSNGNPTTVTASSSAPAVATATVDNATKKVTIRALAGGQATITITNDSNTAKKATITVNVLSFSDSDPYSVDVFPAKNATGVFEDGEFRINFDSAPTLQAGGSIKIIDAATGSIADTIKFADEYQTVGGEVLAAGKNLVRVDGSKLYFSAHKGALAANKTYIVSISDGSVSGTIGGKTFVGLTNNVQNSNFKFTTRASIPSGKTTYIVNNAENASGHDFRSIQGALDAIGNTSDVTIVVKPGYYFGMVYYRGNANVVLRGDTSAKVLSASSRKTDVIIASGNGQPVSGTNASGQAINNAANTKRATFEWRGNNLTISNISFVSTFKRADYPGAGQTQAEAFAVDGTGNTAVYNCSFFSHQDTIRTINKAWFYKCYAEGDIDFLWQEVGGRVALYEECELRALSDEGKETIIAAPGLSAAGKVGKGLVIYNSKIDATAATYLARNPGWTGKILQVAYIKDIFTGKAGLKDTLWKFGTGSANAWGLNSSGAGIELTSANLANALSPKLVGWKIDATSLASTGKAAPSASAGVIADDDPIITNEYSGRRAILNRVIVASTASFEKDAEKHWDIDKVITDNGWTVTEDTSSEVAPGEVQYDTTIYTFPADIGKAGLTTTGISSHGNGARAQAKNGTLKFNVTGNCHIDVKYDYEADFSIQAGSQTKKFVKEKSGSTDQIDEFRYTNWSGAGVVTLEFGTTTSYLNGIVITYDTTITPPSYTTDVNAFAASQVYLDLNGTKTTTKTTTATCSDASQTVTVSYSSETPSVATVNATTGAVTALKVGATRIIATDSLLGNTADYLIVVKNSAAVEDSYKINFTQIAGVPNGDYDFGQFSVAAAQSKDATHGFQFNAGSSLTIHVNGNSTITFGCCQYGSHPVVTMDADGSTNTLATGEGAPTVFNYTGSAADLTFTGLAGAFVHFVEVKPAGAAGLSPDVSFVWTDAYINEQSTANGSVADWNSLIVDATSGKARPNGTWSQWNAGTKALIPVSGDCKIVVQAYDSSTTCGAGSSGTALSNTNRLFVYDFKYATDKVSYNGKYYAQVTPVGYIGYISRLYDLSLTDRAFNAEYSSGTGFNNNKGFFAGMLIDATASGAKFTSNGSSWIQVNTDTVIYIPVLADAKITVNAYQAGYVIKGGATALDTTTAAAVYDFKMSQAVELDGVKYAKITMGSNGYFGSIVLNY